MKLIGIILFALILFIYLYLNFLLVITILSEPWPGLLGILFIMIVEGLVCIIPMYFSYKLIRNIKLFTTKKDMILSIIWTVTIIFWLLTSFL